MKVKFISFILLLVLMKINANTTIDLLSLNSSQGFTMNASSIKAVSGAGDVNGDGIGDIIIGASEKLPSRAYVLYGRKNLAPQIDVSNTTWNLTRGFMITGNLSVLDNLGSWVSSAGDVNGDGIDDVIVGATGVDPDGRIDAGAAYVIYGKKNGLTAHIDISTTFNLTQGFMIKGSVAGDKLGFRVSAAGDVNGDGVGDVIVGSTAADPNGRTNAGMVYVIYGKKDGLTAHIDLNTTFNLTQGFMIKGSVENDFFGYSVGGAGDVNGDGIDDIIVGGSGAKRNGRFYTGVAYVIYGKKAGPTAHIDLNTTFNLTQGFMMTGAFAFDWLGSSVSSAGDINSDGISDIIVGSSGANSFTGAAYVIYGRKDGFTDHIDLKTPLDLTLGFTIRGNALSDNFGVSVSTGDFNGDGISDVIVGAKSAGLDAREVAGITYVIYGKKDGLIANINLNTTLDSAQGFMIIGPGIGQEMGTVVSGAGDVNNDGLEDAVVLGKFDKVYAIYSSCDIGYYFSSNGKCIECPHCNLCTITGCQDCKGSFSLYSSNGKCYATGACPSGTYEKNAKCLNCSTPNCDKCTDTDCQTCKNGFSLYNKDGKCYATGNCPARTYENNSKCIGCSDANCDVCTINGCQTCQDRFSLYNSNGKCYAAETCPSRTYEDNGKCIDCSDANCDICTNAGCQNCKDGYMLDTAQRTCSACPLGTYKGDNKCLDCSDPNCNKCTDTECQSCKKDYLLDSEEGKCYSKSVALVKNSVVTVNHSRSDSTFFTPSTVVAIALPVVEGIAIVFLAIQLIKLRTALMRRRPIRIEPVSTQVSPTPRLSTKSVNYYPSPRLSTKSGNYSPTNEA